jgi:hypothetical protein
MEWLCFRHGSKAILNIERGEEIEEEREDTEKKSK